MKKSLFLIVSCLGILFGCAEDTPEGYTSEFISFALPSANITSQTTIVEIVFSKPTATAGFLTLDIYETNLNYGIDYTTFPESNASKLEVGFPEGASTVSFQLNSLISQSEEEKNVAFTITSSSNNYQITGNTSTILNFNQAVLLGGSMAPEIGGPNQPYQVFVDLSTGEMTSIERTSWDLGFYSGDDFRVILNSTIKMSAKSMLTTDLSIAVAPDNNMIIGQGAGNVNQIDFPDGDLTKTVIAEISENDENNHVYLINLGSNPGTEPPYIGSVGTDTGSHRGWRKIRILRDNANYKLQYAHLQDTTYQEVILSKDALYNFSFFSFTTNSTVLVEPEKTKWDLSFSSFTNVIETTIAYFFADFILNNSRANALAYEVMTEEYSFTNFALSNVDPSKFDTTQTAVGASWRATATNGSQGLPVSQFIVKTNIFYIIKDPNQNYYKLRMTQGVLENGERGHPKFIYSLLK